MTDTDGYRPPLLSAPSHGYADRAFARFRRTGNPDDLETVVREASHSLLNAARAMTGDPDAAEDLVQNTYVAAIAGAHAYDPDHPVVPWLIGILHNRARRRRRERRRPDTRRLPREAPLPDPRDTLVQREFVTKVERTIARLPETYRAVVDLHLRLGLTPQEIAVSLTRSRSTVRTQLARGLAKLRTLLSEPALGPTALPAAS